MNAMRAMTGSAELLAHAIEIEREAAARYTELGERMQDLGNDVVAGLFLRLGAMEAKHHRELEERAQGVTLPAIGRGAYAWLDSGAPETAAHDLVLQFLTPRSALEIALAAEERALAFFESVRTQANDPALAAMAAGMAADEGEHVAWVKDALARTPDPVVDWEAVFR
jgi:rubrerythrin